MEIRLYSIPDDKRGRVVTVHRRTTDGTLSVNQTQPPFTIARPIGNGGLSSTASDYIRFLQMLLNGGVVDGARVLSKETVALMGQNHIGSLTMPDLKSAIPAQSNDCAFGPGDKCGLGFHIAGVNSLASGRPAR